MKEDNILEFKKRSKITEADINGLFMGLVKLVKKIAIEEASENLSTDTKELNEQLQSLSLQLSQKENEIDKLKEENVKLKNRLKVKNLKILQLSCLSAKRLGNYQV